MIQGLPQNKKYKVRIQCSTYNQSKYIEDTLRGFSIQHTNFPFVCCIMDDASTDGEQEVLKQWINNNCDESEVELYDHPLSVIFMAPDKQNRNCIYAVHLLKYNTWGKPERNELLNYWRQQCEYEALCEGDDYWIDPLKLQKQVDIMDKNSDYSMCCSDAFVKTKESDLDWKRYTEDGIIPVEDIILGGGLFIQTATLLYRTEIVGKIYPDFARQCHVGDYPLQIFAALSGKVYWFADKMAVYRFQFGDSWTSKNKSIPCDDKRIKGWQSEINMLKGMDKISNGVYHEVFKQRIVTYVTEIIYLSRYDSRNISKVFVDEIKLLSFKRKIVLFLFRIGLYDFFSDIYHIFHKDKSNLKSFNTCR